MGTPTKRRGAWSERGGAHDAINRYDHLFLYEDYDNRRERDLSRLSRGAIGDGGSDRLRDVI